MTEKKPTLEYGKAERTKLPPFVMGLVVAGIFVAAWVTLMLARIAVDQGMVYRLLP